MIGADEFDPELSQRDRLAVLHHLPADAVQHLVFLQLLFDQRHREPGGVDRDVQLLKDIGDRPDMVLMSVCNDKSFDFAVVLLKIGDVRDHKIDSQHIILREGHAAVNDHDAVPVFYSRNVHTDLLKSA